MSGISEVGYSKAWPESVLPSIISSGRSSRFASQLAREVGSGHTILGGKNTHLGSGQQYSNFIKGVQSGPAYADLSVVGNDILIEVPVRNECSPENSVEEECSAEASMAKSPNSGQSLVAVHSGTAPKHAVLSLGGNENLVKVPVMSDCSTAGDKPKPGPVTRGSSKLDGEQPLSIMMLKNANKSKKRGSTCSTSATSNLNHESSSLEC